MDNSNSSDSVKRTPPSENTRWTGGNSPAGNFGTQFVEMPMNHGGSRPNLAGTLTPGVANRGAVLSRQTSFDHGGEGRLSSTQVKQRLKAYLLSRRKRAAGGGHRKLDEKYPGSFHGTSLTSGYNFSPTHDQGSDGASVCSGYRAFSSEGGYWHSADSANSIEWESTDGIPSRGLLPHSLDLGLHSDARRNPALTPGSECRGNVGVASDSGDHLSGASVSARQADQAAACQEKFDLFTRLQWAARSRDEIRKTSSEPDLAETDYTWPLRLVSQFILNNAQLLSAHHAHAGSNPTTDRVGLNTANAKEPGRWSKFDPCVSTTTAAHTFSLLSPSGSRSTALEPLVEPESGGSSTEKSFDQKDDSSRENSRKSSGPVSSVELPRVSSEEVRSLRESSAAGSGGGGGGPFSSLKMTRKSNEVSMDWEAEPSAMSDVHLPESSAIPPGSRSMSTLTEIRSAESSHNPLNLMTLSFQSVSKLWDSYGRISSLWLSLPVEDWTVPSKNQSSQGACKAEFLPTAIAFDPEMLEHECLCSSAHNLVTHPECPERLRTMLERLLDACLELPRSVPFTPSDLLNMLQAAVSVESPGLQRELSRLTDLDSTFLYSLITRIPLVGFCRLIRARMATEEELCVFHSEDHVITFGQIPSTKQKPSLFGSNPSSPSPALAASKGDSLKNDRRRAGKDEKMVSELSSRLCKLNCGGMGVDSDTVWNPKTTARAARLAVGQVLCLAHKVAHREIRNGFALVRPPGHHAEPNQAMGFCYFNAVAITALHLLEERSVSRVLILDWDIHHGNGTKLATIHPGLVYISIHRFDGGTFFPGTGPVEDCLISPKSSLAEENVNMAARNKTTSSQLINIAWEAPASPDSGRESQNERRSEILDAEDRREIWRSYCCRHKQPSRSGQKVADSRSVETSSSSAFSVMSTRDSDRQHCHCISNPGMGSTGSSHICSICQSFSDRSSLASCGSLQSGPLSDYPKHTRLPDLPDTDFEPPDNGLNRRPLLGLSDAEYMAATRCVIIPIANEFRPDIILISAGFDASSGHGEALGGYSVSPGAFAWITRQCMSLVGSRVVLALEGGYCPSTVSDCTIACLNALLLPSPHVKWNPYLRDIHPTDLKGPVDPEGCVDSWLSASDWISQTELTRPPRPETVKNLVKTIRHHANNGWHCFADISEENIALSFAEAVELEQHLACQFLQSDTGMPKATDIASGSKAPVCTSPLIDYLAQLRMDQT